MKKIGLLIVLTLVFGCKNSSENLTLLKGSYIYFDDAAVLQTNNEVYGVFMNSKALELNQRAEQEKTTPRDVIYVELKGVISTDEDDKIKWEKKFDIKEIVSISRTKKERNTLILEQNNYVRNKKHTRKN